MQYRQLGNTGLLVSSLTVGTMTWGGVDMFSHIGSVEVDEARRQLDRAMDCGVNMVDTSNIYSFGRSEEILGQALVGRRDRVIVATKVRAPMGPGPNDVGLSRHHVIEACNASLKRLGTDYVDLYQLHGWDGITPLEETLRALDDLQRSGKIRYAGVSNFSAWHIMKMLAAADTHHLIRPAAHQIYYSLQCRDAEFELLPIAVDQGVGTLVWSPLSGGLLSGKYRRGLPEPAGTRVANWKIPPVPDRERLYDIVEVVMAIAEQRGVPPAQVSLAWLLSRPGITSVILGARTTAQLEEDLHAAGLVLSAAEIAQLEQASRPPLLYPYWQQKFINADRLSAADLVALGPHLGEATG
jgi:aryl-alcohol dehydrogenase-like predicted oxidoreductase